MEDASTNTDPPNVTTVIGDSASELKIFKTKKPIKECKDERALTSKKPRKDSPSKGGFFRKMGFGSKSASVSPTKQVEKKTQRTASESRVAVEKPVVAVKKSHKNEDPANDEKIDKNAAENQCDPSHENSTPAPVGIETGGTESDARVTQTIIMKKKNLHEASAEAVIVSIDDSHPETISSSVSFDTSVAPHKLTVTANVSTAESGPLKNSSKNHLNVQKQVSSASTVSSTTPSTRTGNSKNSSTCTLSTSVSAPNSSRKSNSNHHHASELDLSGPLSRFAMTVAGDTKKPSNDVSLTEKLSKSFFDLTQGSQDRLQKWKNKLHTGKKIRTKDMSEPPDISRKFPDLSDMDTLLDWTATDKPKFVAGSQSKKMVAPRPLHSSKSVTNALNGILDPDVYSSDANPAIVKKNSLKESSGAGMEHRTLKPRENLNFAGNGLGGSAKKLPLHGHSHYQNMKNLQQLVQTIEGYSNKDLDLPPPARILPYSGIKPQDNGIIRPIAFRPLNQSKDELKNMRENSRSIGNLVSTSTSSSSIAGVRQRSSGLPSTSSASSSTLFPLVTSLSSSKINNNHSADDNDYDTVPEFIDSSRKIDTSTTSDQTNDNYSLIYNFQQTAIPPQQQHHRRAQSGASSTGSLINGNGTGGQFHGFHAVPNSSLTTSSNSSSTTTSGLPNSPPHSSGSSVKKSGSRHSGLHITPSPSDSGIVDYEFQSLIRDKENELTCVRSAMEQNEEVLVRVYQEKERQYQQQINELRQKLQASQQGENALRIQLKQTDEFKNEAQHKCDQLFDEKNSLQRKCQQIERELYSIRNRFEDFVRDTKAQQMKPVACDYCKKPQGSGLGVSGKAPIPTPRSSLALKDDRELRGEVDVLKNEVSSLRDQLNNQMQFFTEERKRWEHDRNDRNSSPKTQFKNSSQDKRTAVLLSNDRLI